ncbi:TetR/AcrR family transcriptional regulator [Micromonospora sp. NBC_00362]|uniref:TetR/AcrR family transcriptional regulator n=1 Tax=Micromonospora sp. NBC_00362 TaxID=2975975 RepID=UPI002256CC8A|nr:TetR/AcrR family transcriptional regulator [Micromonospora sp. NBC_00362]MCX5122100.1 TetR/AcrR family transcriptional regulator [Micromonospora sp. NBC_00362]
MSRRNEVVEAAERILESEGPDAVTMRRLAAELGMRAPSLYKHVANKAEIHAALQRRALEYLAGVLAGAGTDLAALVAAYRRWALEHPRLYELSARYPLDRERVGAEAEAKAQAPLLEATGGNVAAARAIWGLAHGLIDLELAGRFPAGADLQATWGHAIQAFANYLPVIDRRSPDGDAQR